MTITILTPILRQLLQAIGGYLIAKGYFDEATADAFIGIGINLLTLVWWAVDRYRINRANKTNAIIADAVTDKAGA